MTLGTLPARDWALLAESAGRLALAGTLLRVLRFERLAEGFGRHMAESPEFQSEAIGGEVRRIGWAIAATARRLPWKPVCLPQAIVAQWMLRRRGIASTLYLGIDPGRDYDAHAWVRAGQIIVTGGAEQPDAMTVVSSFA